MAILMCVYSERMLVSESHYNVLCTWHPKQYCSLEAAFGKKEEISFLSTGTDDVKL